MLDRRVYLIVVLDQLVAESDPADADLIWKHAGLAIPLQINFALAGSPRLLREVHAALARRQREQHLAGAAAAAAIDTEIRNAVTGFLLESRLALSEKDIPPHVESRLLALAAIADRLHERLELTTSPATTTVALPATES